MSDRNEIDTRSEAERDEEDARDLGSLDLPERYSDWKDEYADAVGIRRHGEI